MERSWVTRSYSSASKNMGQQCMEMISQIKERALRLLKMKSISSVHNKQRAVELLGIFLLVFFHQEMPTLQKLTVSWETGSFCESFAVTTFSFFPLGKSTWFSTQCCIECGGAWAALVLDQEHPGHWSQSQGPHAPGMAGITDWHR